MQKQVDITFEIQEKDYIQLFSNMPALKFQKYKAVFTIIIINIVLYFSIMLYAKSLEFTPEQFALANLLALAVHGTITTILLIKFRKKYKKMVLDIAKEKYQEITGEKIEMMLDKDLNIILINKRSIPLFEEHIKIISTSENYLIYIGSKIHSNKIFVPKKGDKYYKKNLSHIIQYLTELENAQLIEENK
ncbi:hypothetical protein FZC76_22640 [Sutcliffiella horikoshii]|uniref:YcxB-like protein domain-containing protein n=1 Tax=Sutcliffiella horikoshii TaxID=79883 RepID=A0A5D4S657_9BACI|nr:hypothetical protein [Sutcliffiella horikoshii]TYS58399.1 hypothetical protein FZC76_22640 [Sutcliffiella horikoshii]